LPLEKINKFQIKYAHLLLIILIFFSIFTFYIAREIKIDPNLSNLVADDSEFNSNQRKLDLAFGNSEAVILFIKIDEKTRLPNTPSTLNNSWVDNYIEQLNYVFSQSQYVNSISPPQYSSDLKAAQIIISVQDPSKIGGINQIVEEFDYLLSELQTPPGTKTTLSGFPIILNKISSLLISDNLNTLAITFIFIFLTLFLFSRNIYFTLTTIAIPIISLLFLGAILVLLDISITVTLAAVGVLILGLGVDYSIHFSIHYNKLKKEYNYDYKKAIVETIKYLKMPIFASFLTTFAGFIALALGFSPSSQSQGLVLSIGIAVIFFTSFIVFPILMTIFHSRINIEDSIIFDKILKFLSTIAKIEIRYPKIVLSILAIITIIMLFGASKVEFSTSNSNWIPEEDETSIAFREIISKFQDEDNIFVIVQSNNGDLRNLQTVRDVNEFKKKLEAINNIDEVISPFTNIRLDELNIYDNITNNPIIRSSFNEDFTLTVIRLESKNLGIDEEGNSQTLKEIRGIVKDTPIYNADIFLYGNPIRFEELGDSLEKDAARTTMIGLGLVFLVVSFLYFSVKIGLLALIPIILAVIWAVGLMGFFKVPFTSLSTGIISLVLGVGVDFSIHLLDSIKKLQKKMSFEEAIERTLTSSGKAIFLSSLTTFLGFISLSFAVLLGTQRLGFSLAFSIISVFVISILFVPTILSLGNKKNENIKKKK
jgi:hydrophobe/amphiphile efflux-3 (HAE3) family protein